MDIPAQWAMGLLHGLLPASTIDFLQSHLLDPSSPLQAIRRTAGASLAGLWPIVALAGDRLTQSLLNSPDIVVLVFLLTTILVTVQVIAWTRRLVVSLTRLAFKMVFYAAVVGVAAALYQRGLEASVRDAIVIGAKVWGYMQGVKDVFLREYERYVAEEKARVRTSPGMRNGRATTGGWR